PRRDHAHGAVVARAVLDVDPEEVSALARPERDVRSRRDQSHRRQHRRLVGRGDVGVELEGDDAVGPLRAAEGRVANAAGKQGHVMIEVDLDVALDQDVAGCEVREWDALREGGRGLALRLRGDDRSGESHGFVGSITTTWPGWGSVWSAAATSNGSARALRPRRCRVLTCVRRLRKPLICWLPLPRNEMGSSEPLAGM